MKSPPFDIGPRTIIVGYFLSAEMDCFLELGWPCPANLLDLFVEFRNQINGHMLPLGFSIQSCLQYFGEQMIADKEHWRQVAITGPKTEEDWRGLMAYCMEDVDACNVLLPKVCGYLQTHDDLRRALLRGRYAWAVAGMQHRGVPIDMPLYTWVTSRLESIAGEVRESLNPKYGVFRANGSFDHARFRQYLIRENVAFPLDDAGRRTGAGGETLAERADGNAEADEQDQREVEVDQRDAARQAERVTGGDAAQEIGQGERREGRRREGEGGAQGVG